VQGEDRHRLLHAITTNDVNNLAEGQGLYLFFLNANGRILADGYVYNTGSVLWVDTEAEMGESLLAHIDKYIIADDVTLQDYTVHSGTIGLEGPKSLEKASELEIPVPEQPLGVMSFRTGFVARVASTGQTGLRIVLPVADAQSFVSQLMSAGLSAATAQEARTVRLENRIPRFGEDITERYLVQETQQLQAVHFNKGCYLGQEIVERVRSRGQVHRLLTPVATDGSVVPERETKVSVEGKEVGEITSAVYSPGEQRVVGFAYLRGEGLLPESARTIELDVAAVPVTLR
jgi:tRNA-modifying protein YgfZ